jgi:ankyrin repeat protein
VVWELLNHLYQRFFESEEMRQQRLQYENAPWRLQEALAQEDYALARLHLHWIENINSPCVADGGTVLHWAAAEASPDTIIWLERQGAWPTIRDAKGERPLHKAARRTDVHALTVVKLLAKCGAQYVENIDGCYAYDIAAANNQGEIMRYLSTLSTDVNKVHASGNIYLHDAVRLGEVGWAKWLLEQGANAYALNNQNQTPLASLREANNSNQDCIRLLEVWAKISPPKNYAKALRMGYDKRKKGGYQLVAM